MRACLVWMALSGASCSLAFPFRGEDGGADGDADADADGDGDGDGDADADTDADGDADGDGDSDADGDADADADADGDGDADPEDVDRCVTAYGALPDFVLCSARSGQCSFFVTTGDLADCDGVCESTNGGWCLSAYDTGRVQACGGSRDDCSAAEFDQRCVCQIP